MNIGDKIFDTLDKIYTQIEQIYKQNKEVELKDKREDILAMLIIMERLVEYGLQEAPPPATPTEHHDV